MKITLSFSKSNTTTKTTVTSTSVFPTKEVAKTSHKHGCLKQGMNQTLDQLDALLK